MAVMQRINLGVTELPHKFIGFWYVGLPYEACGICESVEHHRGKRTEFYVGKQRVFPTHFIEMPEAAELA